jgi:hypothetical protein
MKQEARHEAAPAHEEPRQEQPRREEPRHEEPVSYAPPETPAPRAEEPKVDAKQLLESSGLVMIETDRSKAVYQPEPEQPVHIGRPRRERNKPPPADDDLVQIETKR